VFNPNPLGRQTFVLLFLTLRQGMQLAAFMRQLGIGMNFSNALITQIRQQFCCPMQFDLALFENRKVMFFAFGKGCRQYRQGVKVYEDLTFERVPFLFATVIVFLVFLGR